MTTHTTPPHTPTDDAEWLTMAEICARMKKSIDTAYKWSGKGYPYWPREAVKLPNDQWRCRDCDLEAWLDTQPWRKVTRPGPRNRHTTI